MIRFRATSILLLIIVFAFVLFLGGTMPYYLLYLLLLTFLLPLAHSLVTLKYLKGYVNIPSESLFAGEDINIEYEVTNNSLFVMPYLEIHSNISKQLTGISSNNVALSLQKKETFTYSESITLKRRGYYELGEIIVTVHDVFGLYSFKKRISSSISLLVYPKTVNLSTFRITSSHQSGEALIQNSVFQDKSRVASLREYNEGDSVKAIHWKLSAKKDTPIVREYESHGDTYATIFIDNDSKHFKNDVDRRLEDKSANIALSIVDYCLNQNIAVNMETQDTDKYIKVQGQQSSDYKPFLEVLARFKSNGAFDFKSLLLSKAEMLKRSSTVIIITPSFDKETCSTVIQLKMKNLNPLFILVTDIENSPSYIDQKVQTMFAQEGIPIYILDHNANIKDALEVCNG